MGITDTSRFISLILRHKPETIGITLDEHGWANVKDLIDGIKKTRPIDMDMLEEIVGTDLHTFSVVLSTVSLNWQFRIGWFLFQIYCC